MYEKMLSRTQPDQNTGPLFNSDETKGRFTSQKLETIEDEGYDDGRTASAPDSTLKPSGSSVKPPSYPHSGQSFMSGRELSGLT